MEYTEAVWVADAYAKEEIDRRARVYAFGKIVERGYGDSKRYAALVDSLSTKFVREDGGQLGEFKEWHEAYETLQRHVANFGKPNVEQFQRGHDRALYEVAKNCVKTYDSWQSGDNYGVICVDYDAEGKQVGDEDACWGHVGLDWAREARDDYVKEMKRV